MATQPRTPSFVHTGPGTVAGRYLRRFWQPVCEADKLAPGQARPIRVMGDDFTLYRGETGTPHIVAFRCPHRGTQLSTGWIEGDDLRCYFHGWKFSPEGVCLEQPAEPRPFCEKVSIVSYPAREQLGLIFGYFGDAPVPELPRWPEFETEPRVSSMARIPCNYFQSAENIVDDAHVGFVHRTVEEIGRSPRGVMPLAVTARETPYGLSIAYANSAGIAHNHYLMPNQCYLSYTLDRGTSRPGQSPIAMRTLFWYVPIDDENHFHCAVTTGDPLVIHLMRKERDTPHSVAEEIQAVLAGESNAHKQLARAGRQPDLVRIQDGVTIVGQGAIADRSRDHLGASDAGVILLRKIWMRELRALASGGPLTSFAQPTHLPL